jgi:hypothetical protein
MYRIRGGFRRMLSSRFAAAAPLQDGASETTVKKVKIEANREERNMKSDNNLSHN